MPDPVNEAVKMVADANASAAPPVEPKPEAPVDAKPEVKAEPKPEAKEPVDAFSKRFEALTKREEEIRQREAALKASARVPPAMVAKLIEHAEKGDVAGALAALGFKQEQLVSQLSPKADPKSDDAVPEVVKRLESRLEQYEAKLRAQEAKELKAQAGVMVGEALKGIQGLRNLPAMDDEAVPLVLGQLEHMYAQHGGFQGSVEDAIEMAAKLVDEDLERQKSRWAKLLTTQQGGGTVPGKAPVTADGARESRTLHNGLAVGTAGTTDPVADAIELVRNSQLHRPS